MLLQSADFSLLRCSVALDSIASPGELASIESERKGLGIFVPALLLSGPARRHSSRDSARAWKRALPYRSGLRPWVRGGPLRRCTPKKRRDGRLRTPDDPPLDQFQFPSPSDHLRTAAHPQLAVEVVQVGLHGPHADEELGGDTAVGLARGHELEYLMLAPAQGFG
jgi:hypothetical protein